MTTIGRSLLPLRCLVCGTPGVTRDLCADCARDLPWNTIACARCALPLPVAAAACGECLRSPPAFDAGRAPLRYAAPVDRLLTRFKFHAGLAEGRLLAELLLESLATEPLTATPDLILPLPLHRSRLGRRGYNQALELARPLAEALHRPLAIDALTRTRATAPQTELDADARRRNLRDAFSASADAVANRSVLLVDDVITTGATIREASACLRRAGATSVSVAAVARAPH